MPDEFRAIWLSKTEAGDPRTEIRTLTSDDLMDGDVDIRVEATTLNYKDGLALTGKAPVVRRWPMIPGIDLAGTVIASRSPDWREGDAVLLNGWGIGESHFGAYAGRARVRAEWLIARPKAFSPLQAMAIGTAGYTAMLCVLALERAGLAPDRGPAVVTGASGGVGSVAVAVLAKLGWHVIASTGRTAESDWLRHLGAAEIIDRSELGTAGRPLEAERWAAGVDSVGSHTLVRVLSATKAEGAVAACGLAQGMDLPASVAPFILRGVSLLGINSVTQSRARRIEAWERLASDLDPAALESITTVLAFDDLLSAGEKILRGEVRGRLAVDMMGEG